MAIVTMTVAVPIMPDNWLHLKVETALLLFLNTWQPPVPVGRAGPVTLGKARRDTLFVE